MSYLLLNEISNNGNTNDNYYKKKHNESGVRVPFVSFFFSNNT